MFEHEFDQAEIDKLFDNATDCGLTSVGNKAVYAVLALKYGEDAVKDLLSTMEGSFESSGFINAARAKFPDLDYDKLNQLLSEYVRIK